MKKFKLTLVVLGLIALVVGGVLLFMVLSVDLKVIWEIATRYQGGGTTKGLTDPRPKMGIICGLAVGAGLLIGLGLGLPLHRSLSQKKLDALVEQRVQQRLAAQAAPEAPEASAE